tara:strand:+ start:1308 stop:2087 length:780 start_codon:yes stop_codon:yes gene_type:complete
MKKLRIALCLSGLIRDFGNSGASYNEFLCKDYNTDVFIHTWNNNSEVNKNTRFSSSPKLVDPVDKERFFKEIFTHANIKLQLENFDSDWNFRRQYGNDASPRTTAIMYYSVYKSNLLKKTKEVDENFKYDVVIRSRMDFLLKEKIPKKELEVVCSDKNIVYVGQNSCCEGKGLYDGSRGVVDQFAFGSSQAMDVYSNCYIDQNNMAQVGGEIVLASQFKQNKLIPTLTSYKFKGLAFVKKDETVYWEDFDNYEKFTFKT